MSVSSSFLHLCVLLYTVYVLYVFWWEWYKVFHIRKNPHDHCYIRMTHSQTGHPASIHSVIDTRIAQDSLSRACPHGTSAKPARGATRTLRSSRQRQSMWTERSGKISRSSLNFIYGSPAHRSDDIPLPQSRSAPLDFLNPVHRSAPLIWLSNPLRSAPRSDFRGEVRSQIFPPTDGLYSSHYNRWFFSFVAGRGLGTCMILNSL